MKRALFAAALFALLSNSSVLLAGDHAMRTIRSDEPTFVINVPKNRVLRVINFVQDVQTFTPQDGGGQFSNPAGQLFVSSDGRTPVPVMTASFATQSEVQKDFTIPGPAAVSVNPVPGATLVVTYRGFRD